MGLVSGAALAVAGAGRPEQAIDKAVTNFPELLTKSYSSLEIYHTVCTHFGSCFAEISPSLVLDSRVVILEFCLTANVFEDRP